MSSVRRLFRGITIGFGVLIALVLITAASVFVYARFRSSEEVSLPEPNGPYAVGRVSYHWIDHSREETFTEKKGDKRELMAFVWYPAKKQCQHSTTAAYLPGRWGGERQKEYGNWSFLVQRLDSVRTHSFENAQVAGTKDRYPMLVMEPGLGPLPTDYTTLAESLASNGYVVVTSAPTYSASLVVFPDGRVARSTALGSFPGNENAPVTTAKIQKDKAAGTRLVEVWAKDMIFELDRMKKLDAARDGRFYGRFDLDQVGMFGHSLGGATALSACASYDQCRAAANLDGTPYGAGKLLRNGSPKPYMYVASESVSSTCDRECREGNRWTREVYEHSESGAYYLTVKGARHFDFSDYAALFWPILRLQGLLGPINGRRALHITNAYLLAFMNKYLKDTDEPILHSRSLKYPAVRFESH